jgi:hypothetical protein
LGGAESVACRDPLASQNQSHPSTLSTVQKGSHPRRETVASVDPNRKEPSKTVVRRRAHAQPRHPSLRAADSPGDQNNAPDPRVRSLIAGFCQVHQAALGQPYLVMGGRDGAALKRALRMWDEPALTATLQPYFADPWALDHGPTIPKWVSQIPSLLRQAQGSSGGFVG